MPATGSRLASTRPEEPDRLLAVRAAQIKELAGVLAHLLASGERRRSVAQVLEGCSAAAQSEQHLVTCAVLEQGFGW